MTILFAAGALAGADPFAKDKPEFLPVDQAFELQPLVSKGGVIEISWRIAKDYYLYRDKLKITTSAPGLKLDVRVPEVYLARVAAGQKLSAELDAFPGQKFTGAVAAVDPQLDPNGRSVVLRASLANPDGKLRPGLFARVTLELGKRENAMLLPEQALWPQGEKQMVYVVKDGKAELVEVKIGARRAGWVEIVSGLTPQSEVITAGQLKIGPGAPVAPVGGASGAQASSK